MSKTLNEFKNMINNINDNEHLDVIEMVLNEMLEIQKMKEMIEKFELELITGKKAHYWFIAMNLDPENEIDVAMGTVLGRKRVLADKIKRNELIEKINKEEEKINKEE